MLIRVCCYLARYIYSSQYSIETPKFTDSYPEHPISSITTQVITTNPAEPPDSSRYSPNLWC
ncbi:hypothetical protein BDV40DRAFT_233325 [Aspergillus tamarii]|uniref:Uncharacterized protein n=1 Tax=Aspergillus tamarii TaxID=41984 RepID=A0A5N6ULU3_ASPTM|nr:hypothetical protein BDV40DRAFT_233325 [Aspergillus tamarii]